MIVIVVISIIIIQKSLIWGKFLLSKEISARKNPQFCQVQARDITCFCLVIMDNGSSQESALGAHLKTHIAEKWHKCNQCDFASSYASALKDHFKTHSGEKPNQCNQCDFSSSQVSNLRRHLETHSGKKSNKCNQCGYASSQAGHLRTHLITHRSEK